MMDSGFMDRYRRELYERLSMVVDLDEGLESLVEEMIDRARMTQVPVVLENNYKNTEIRTEAGRLLDLYYEKGPVLSGYGVLYQNPTKRENVPGKVVEYILSRRKSIKKEMFEHANDIDQSVFNKLDVYQKVVKILANSWFGAFGQRSFHFYNPNSGPSVTYTGQHIITTAILGFEALLAGNFTFVDLDELMYYTNNVLSESLIHVYLPESVKWLTEDEADVSVEEVVEWLKSKCDFTITDFHEAVIETIVERASSLGRTKLIFKNNLGRALGCKKVRKAMKSLADTDYLNGSEPPEHLKDKVRDLMLFMKEYVFYPKPHEFKADKAVTMEREVILLSDTDSTFLAVDGFVDYMKEILKKDAPTEREVVNYIAIITGIVTDFIEDAFAELTEKYNVPEEKRRLVNMKNEFVLRRVLLTKNKKNYAGVILAQEGKILDKPKIDIKGIRIKKVDTPKVARKFFASILENDILLAESIDSAGIFNKYMSFERSIRDNIVSGKTDFAKPAKYSNMNTYKFPYRMQVVRGVILWNILYPKKTIPRFSNVDLISFLPYDEELFRSHLPSDVWDKVKEKYLSVPDLEKYGIDVLAVPKDAAEVPDFFVPLINVEKIINGIMNSGNILLESLGFRLVKSNSYRVISNLVEL
jgi:hypothetical protein